MAMKQHRTDRDAPPEESVTMDPQFFDRLKSVRRHLDQSQKQMDDLIGIGKGSWQRYERGQVPGGRVSTSLAKLGINLNWLMTGEGDMVEGDSASGAARPHELQAIDLALDVLSQWPESTMSVKQFTTYLKVARNAYVPGDQATNEELFSDLLTWQLGPPGDGDGKNQA